MLAVHIKRDYGPPLGRVECVLEIPESRRWDFIQWLFDGRPAPGPAGQDLEPEPQSEPERNLEMAKLSDIVGGKFMKKEDVDPAVLGHIASVERQDVGMDGQPEMKWVVTWQEDLKPMVLNSTNANIIGNLYGHETDLWVGKPIVLFNDPNVAFAGKIVGGIRVRAPKQRPAAQAKTAAKKPATPFDDMEDDVI